ncbi:TMV resistance protein N-like [Quercus lobata]|uniref:TMV resistance protein N-like n=1 Tax=Quercus lobata TaxID=97700 RepID=UPI001244FD79|nr:TMV resistance protein N-like [Quercus lobata]
MDSCVEEMLDSYIGEGLGGVRVVGICGMGGMGKTTLAREIYRRISSKFEARSFIANIREETKNQGLVSLQKQLLSKILMESEINIWDVCEGINVIRNTLCNKNVFIILDDVDGDEQLEALAGKHDWFGPGSRIIVTSRDSHLLIRCGVDYIYIAKELNNDDALQLFSWKAFHKPHPEENYVNLSMDFVNYAKGLPLALKVLGSSLFAKRSNEWKSALYKLKKEEPNRKFLDILQIGFDGLTNLQKGLFLDIACFFKGENKDCKRDILESFCCSLDYDIGVLMDKSLITIDDYGTLWMHDLLQVMGQEIVRRESPKEPGGRSRLWIYDDVIHVLKNNSILDALKLMDLSDSQCLIEIPDLSGALKLKQLILRHCTRLYKIHTSLGDLKQLIQLDLNGCKCLEILPHKISLEALEIFDLGGCSRLKKFPEIVGNMLHLLKLCLSETAIKDLPLSMEHLTGLIKLDLRDYKNLSSLSNGCCCSKSLEILTLSGCSKLDTLPKNLGNIEGLEELDLSGTAITRLPLSVVHLKNLKRCYNPNRFTYLTIPRSEIPNWFRHQNVGASVNLQVPSHLLFSSKFMGIAVCIVYIFRQHHPLHQLHIHHFRGTICTHSLLCSVEANGFRYSPVWLPLMEEFGKIELYHLWLEYFPYKAHFERHHKEELDANEFTQIKVTFESFGPGLEVTKCGAHLIFEQDIKDLNQTKPGSSSCSITPYYEDDDLGDSEKDTKIKECRDDEATHPEWTKHPNLIEN